MKNVMLVDGSMEEGFEVIELDQDPAELKRQILNLANNFEDHENIPYKLTFAKYTQRQIDESNIRGEYWGGHFDEAEMNRRMAALTS